MNLLFVHNIRLKKDTEGNLYTHSSYNEEVWNRYLSISNKLSIITRQETKIFEKSEACQKFEPFDSKKINHINVFDLTKSISSFLNIRNRIKNGEIIKNAVYSHDVIIARLPSIYGYMAVKYAKKYNKPYLIEVVACAWDSYWNHSIKGKILAPYNYLRLKKYVKYAPYTIYVTNHFLQNRYPTRGKNIGISDVTLTNFDSEILEKRLAKIKSMNGKIVIGTTAAVNVKSKGQQYVIKALGKLKKQGITNFQYQLVGGGDPRYLQSVAKKYDVENQVVFLGPKTHDEVFKWLDTIDIYAQPSRQEGLPRALVEAMSRGLPAFGARTGGIPELLDSKCIFSNTKKNIDEICDILISFDKNFMIKQALRNYNESKKYCNDNLNKKRKLFLKQFSDSV